MSDVNPESGTSSWATLLGVLLLICYKIVKKLVLLALHIHRSRCGIFSISFKEDKSTSTEPSPPATPGHSDTET